MLLSISFPTSKSQLGCEASSQGALLTVRWSPQPPTAVGHLCARLEGRGARDCTWHVVSNSKLCWGFWELPNMQKCCVLNRRPLWAWVRSLGRTCTRPCELGWWALQSGIPSRGSEEAWHGVEQLPVPLLCQCRVPGWRSVSEPCALVFTSLETYFWQVVLVFQFHDDAKFPSEMHLFNLSPAHHPWFSQNSSTFASSVPAPDGLSRLHLTSGPSSALCVDELTYCTQGSQVARPRSGKTALCPNTVE